MSEHEMGLDVSHSRIELVIFRVNDLVCALKSTDVQEIIKQQETTPVHNAENYVVGVINLRGSIVTVLDLHTKFGLERESESVMRTVITTCDGEAIGLLVDDVDDILKADVNAIEAPPANLNGMDSVYFSGIFKMDDKLVAIINLEELLKVEV